MDESSARERKTAKVTEKDWKTDRRCAAVRQGNVYDYKSPNVVLSKRSVSRGSDLRRAFEREGVKMRVGTPAPVQRSSKRDDFAVKDKHGTSDIVLPIYTAVDQTNGTPFFFFFFSHVHSALSPVQHPGKIVCRPETHGAVGARLDALLDKRANVWTNCPPNLAGGFPRPRLDRPGTVRHRQIVGRRGFCPGRTCAACRL